MVFSARVSRRRIALGDRLLLIDRNGGVAVATEASYTVKVDNDFF
jgi:hypothetical protein